MIELEPLAEETDEERIAREAHVRDWRSRSALRAAAALATHVRSIAVGGKSETGETLREWSAPMRITASDDVDQFFAQLVDWRTYWQRWVPSTATASFTNRSPTGEVIGFAAGTTPLLAGALVRYQTRLLLEWADTIATRDAATAYHEDVTNLVWQLRAKYPERRRPERPVSPRPCPICGLEAVQADWYVEGDPASVRIECTACGHRIPITNTRNGATAEWLPTTHISLDPKLIREERLQLLLKPLLRPSEAAYLVGKSTSQVNRWILNGLPTYKHPWQKYRHVKLAEVRDWIEAHPTRHR